MTLPYLTTETCEPLLDWLALCDAIAEGHKGAPPQIHDTFITRGGDTLLSRAAWIDGLGFGVKSVSVFPSNAAQGRPSVQGAMLVFDDATGAVEAVIENALITRWKTAADSLLGARLLMRPGARRLLIIGAGAVAEALIAAYRALIPDLEISLWARRAERAQHLATRYNLTAVDDLALAVPQADIIATATMATEPILRGEWLQPGQHVDLIGAFTPQMREADDSVLVRGSLFVDSRATTIGHIGEVMIPMAAGVITAADIRGDLADLVQGRAGRQDDHEITVFKNGGGAHLDLMTARYILARWRAAAGA